MLRPAAGRPLVVYLLERLHRVDDLDDVMIATSDDASDDAVAALARAQGVACHRGPLDDVALRMLGAAEAAKAEAFVRISGDSPLLDQAIVSRAIALFRDQRPDLASNVKVRSFPKGQSVEVLDADAFRRGYPLFENAGDREHVTPFFYRRSEQFKIAEFRMEPPADHHQLSVDTEDDFRRFEAILARTDRPHWDYALEDILDLLARIDAEAAA